MKPNAKSQEAKFVIEGLKTLKVGTNESETTTYETKGATKYFINIIIYLINEVLSSFWKSKMRNGVS